MCFVADLISNCFFEVNDVYILCFPDILSVRFWLARYLLFYLPMVIALLLLYIIFDGEFNGKHWFLLLLIISYIAKGFYLVYHLCVCFNVTGKGK